MREAERAGAHDAILLNGKGFVTETSSSNIFAILGTKLNTPPLNSGCLSGITRGYILELAIELGIETTQEDLEYDQLKLCEGIFLTNSAREIQAVKTLDGEPIRQSSLTVQLQQAYRQKVLEVTS